VKSLSFLKYACLLMGIAMLVPSLYFYKSTSTFLKDAIKTEGTVVALDRTVSKAATNDPLGRKTSVSYKPVVNFVTPNGEKVEFFSTLGSNPPMYHKGQKVEVVYTPAEPHNARIYDFFSLWGIALIFGSAGGILVLIGGGIMLATSMKERSDQYLREQGVRINTDFQRVVMNTSLRVNGRHPFQILTQWQNPSTSKIHLFQSKNLWYDPTSHIKNRQITVFIERDNPKKYLVDLSFLPEISD
jgi:hypothetical protein